MNVGKHAVVLCSCVLRGSKYYILFRYMPDVVNSLLNGLICSLHPAFIAGIVLGGLNCLVTLLQLMTQMHSTNVFASQGTASFSMRLLVIAYEHTCNNLIQ